MARKKSPFLFSQDSPSIRWRDEKETYSPNSNIFLMCSVEDCQQKTACLRHEASGTAPKEGQPYGDWCYPVDLSSIVNIDPLPPYSGCIEFLPAIQSDGTIQLPVHMSPTLASVVGEKPSLWWLARISRYMIPPFILEDEIRESHETMRITQDIPSVEEIGLDAAKELASAGWEIKGFNLFIK